MICIIENVLGLFKAHLHVLFQNPISLRAIAFLKKKTFCFKKPPA
jgi:hypothetical protein